jgi:hypothetical protein
VALKTEKKSNGLVKRGLSLFVCFVLTCICELSSVSKAEYIEAPAQVFVCLVDFALVAELLARAASHLSAAKTARAPSAPYSFFSFSSSPSDASSGGQVDEGSAEEFLGELPASSGDQVLCHRRLPRRHRRSRLGRRWKLPFLHPRPRKKKIGLLA